jgi:hypothetical protein
MTLVITTNSVLLIKALLKRIGVAADCRCRSCGGELSFWRIVKQDQFCCWDHRTRWRLNQLIRVLGIEGVSDGLQREH